MRIRSGTFAGVKLIGVDWAASDETKRGLALAELDARGAIALLEVCSGTRGQLAEARIGEWLAAIPEPESALVGIDAPLGWPRALARGLADHRAGESLGAQETAAELFDRAADRHVHRTYGKKPLEVGADRIARTAFSALALVAALRRDHPLQLGWEPPRPGERLILEVYPAATLRVLAGGRTAPYKRPEDQAARRNLTAMLAEHVAMTRKQRTLAESSDHLLDAIACTVAAADFAAGRCPGPPAELGERARHEGWIWVRSP